MNIQTDRAMVPAGHEAIRHLLVTVTAPGRTTASTRMPVHVSVVLDRSGSMGGSKITLAKKATSHALQLLGEAAVRILQLTFQLSGWADPYGGFFELSLQLLVDLFGMAELLHRGLQALLGFAALLLRLVPLLQRRAFRLLGSQLQVTQSMDIVVQLFLGFAQAGVALF